MNFARHPYPALLIIKPSCLGPDPNCPSTMNIIKCEPRCTVILTLIPPHQETKTKKQTESRGKNLAPLYPSLCTVCMVALKPTEVEVKVIELAQ